MTKLEQNLIDVIYRLLEPETPASDVYAIFSVDIGNGHSSYSGEVFVQNDTSRQDAADVIGEQNWFAFLDVVSEPLRAIYDKQQQFVYLIIEHDNDGNFKFTYENMEHVNSDMTLSNRFIVWEYDEFGIGDRNIPLYNRVLNEYRPVK